MGGGDPLGALSVTGLSLPLDPCSISPRPMPAHADGRRAREHGLRAVTLHTTLLCVVFLQVCQRQQALAQQHEPRPREVPICGGAPKNMLPFKIQGSPYDLGYVQGARVTPARRRALLATGDNDIDDCTGNTTSLQVERSSSGRKLLRWTWKRVGCGLRKRMKVQHENDGVGGSRFGTKAVNTPGDKALDKCLRDIKFCNTAAYETASALPWLRDLSTIPRVVGMFPRMKPTERRTGEESDVRGGEESEDDSSGGGGEWTPNGLVGAPATATTATKSPPTKLRGRGGGAPPLRSCALVGNAGHLVKKKYGKYIDNHDVVLRFNTAPIGPEYRANVGSKTSARVLNNSRSVSACCEGKLPASDSKDIAMIMWFPANRAEMRSKCRSKYPGNKLTFLSRRMISSQVRTMKSMRNNARKFGLGPFGSWRQLTSGGHAILAMVNMCESVSLYGFTTFPQSKRGPDQYKGRAQKTMSGQEWHDWSGESIAWRMLHASGRGAICSM